MHLALDLAWHLEKTYRVRGIAELVRCGNRGRVVFDGSYANHAVVQKSYREFRDSFEASAALCSRFDSVCPISSKLLSWIRE